MDGKIAVLGVVIAGVLATIVEEGKYTQDDTVIGITLLLTLVAFNDPRLTPGSPLEQMAKAFPKGLCTPPPTLRGGGFALGAHPRPPT